MKKPAPLKSRRHCIIPDVQVKPGVRTDHLEWIGRYIAEKRPEVIVCLGDFADLPSLSHFDVGKLSGEGHYYADDIEAAKEGMLRLTDPFMTKGYNPLMVLTLGNHENRINRAVNEQPKLYKTLKTADLEYESFGWRVIPFLKPIKIDGFTYVHYVTTGAKGLAAGTAKKCMSEIMGSVVVGHNQNFDIAVHPKTQQIAIMSATCYLHKEGYLGEQGQNHRRQIIMLNEVNNGHADPMLISLAYLGRKYGNR